MFNPSEGWFLLLIRTTISVSISRFSYSLVSPPKALLNSLILCWICSHSFKICFLALWALSCFLKRCSVTFRATSCCVERCSAALRAHSCYLNRLSVALWSSSCCLKKCKCYSSFAKRSCWFCMRAIFCFDSSTSIWLVHSSRSASTITLSFSCLRFDNKLIVEEGLLQLSRKISSGRSATTVANKSGLDSKCFWRHDDHCKTQRSLAIHTRQSKTA